MSKKTCKTCKVEQDITEFQCIFRVKREGFKNCNSCRSNYRYYHNREDRNILSKYKKIDIVRKNPQCLNCIWTGYDKDWLCIHRHEKRYNIQDDMRRLRIYNIPKGAPLVPRPRNISIKKIDEIEKVRAIKQIPREKFTLKFSVY